MPNRHKAEKNGRTTSASFDVRGEVKRNRRPTKKHQYTSYSVMLCVYKNDKPAYFREALESIIHQTVIPSEIVVVVDGPVPSKVLAIIAEYSQKHRFIKSVRLKKNLGAGAARKICLENCTNELVANMDSDDISVRDRFEKQLNCFNDDAELSVVGGYIFEFTGDTNNVVAVRTVPLKNEEIKKYMKSRNPLNNMSVMFKKSAVLKAGGYVDFHFYEDYYLWIRMCVQSCQFKNINSNLVFARVGEAMYKRRGGVEYFISGARLQVYMYKIGFIGLGRCIYNLTARFLVQILMPNLLRSVVYRKVLRRDMEKGSLNENRGVGH